MLAAFLIHLCWMNLQFTSLPFFFFACFFIYLLLSLLLHFSVSCWRNKKKCPEMGWHYSQFMSPVSADLHKFCSHCQGKVWKLSNARNLQTGLLLSGKGLGEKVRTRGIHLFLGSFTPPLKLEDFMGSLLSPSYCLFRALLNSWKLTLPILESLPFFFWYCCLWGGCSFYEHCPLLKLSLFIFFLSSYENLV